VGHLRPITLNDLHPLPPLEDRLETTAPLFRAAFRGKVLPALLSAFRTRFLRIFALLSLLTALGLLRPLLLRELIQRFSPSEGAAPQRFFAWIQTPLGMAGFAIGCFVLLGFVRSHFLRHCFKLTWSMPGLLRHELYQKLLHLKSAQRNQLTSGEYVNLATRDCDSTSMLPFLLEPLLYPVTIAAYCIMLVSFLGPWALLAVVALAAVVPLGRRLERRMSDLASRVRE
jgi:ABC-type multidrug transport system fused ATPase/permease subunit